MANICEDCATSVDQNEEDPVICKNRRGIWYAKVFVWVMISRLFFLFSLFSQACDKIPFNE
jgi:hypothetical protein